MLSPLSGDKSEIRKQGFVFFQNANIQNMPKAKIPHAPNAFAIPVLFLNIVLIPILILAKLTHIDDLCKINL